MPKHPIASDSIVILLKHSLFFSSFPCRYLNHVCSDAVCCVGAGLRLFRAVRPPAQTLSVQQSAAQCPLWSVVYACSHFCLPLPAHWPPSPAYSISQQSISQRHRESPILTARGMCVESCVCDNDIFPMFKVKKKFSPPFLNVYSFLLSMYHKRRFRRTFYMSIYKSNQILIKFSLMQ